ncbi:type IV pilus assembly protein PilM [Planctomicrobium piriforme]|uniref:Type IV pilus assembly protein PilM n=1 Tax=Planctomicrobium piriforme TaxID=1576369 RepID=A0A1I3RIT1_9PLAN|nr:type IV pilus assembly protein PilM [Planctomicrobium piriforme]SFJ46483.1 type IV pilus assembly protein PilM [Planctomicrobium piriforme]
MAEPRAAWGIDIGQSALKAIKLRYVAGTDQIVAEAFDYIPFPKILSQPDAIPDEIVPQAMETFLSRNNLKGDAVVISVPGQSALARFIQLPPVESSKLHEIVKYEARQQIPFALDDVIWDYQPLGAGAEESGFLLDAEVGLFAMKRDQIQQQLKPYQNAKVEVEIIQIAPLALYSVLSLDELKIRRGSTGEPGDEYYIMLDMGCDNTTLMVSNGYKIWIRNVPIGGNHFTRALTKEMKLSFAKAEHLKCNATKSPDPRAVFQALRPVFNDYVSEIQRSIGYFSSVNRSAKVMKVVGLGNGFKLAGLQKFLQQNLQYPVERPDTFQQLTGDAVLSSPMFAENVLSFAVPYGLALQGLELTRIRTSLLPPEISAARRIRKKKPWAVAAAAVLLLCFVLSTIGNAISFASVNTPDFKRAEDDAKAYSGEIGKFKQDYSGQEGANAGLKVKLDAYTTNLRDLSWIEVFNAVLDCMPRDPADVEIPIDQVEKKNQISLLQFTADRVADRGNWFNSLTPQMKQLMAPADREAPPAGDGYIFTLKGEHYHDDPKNPEESYLLYVINHFLKNLQQPTVQPADFPLRDVTRLGISHATVVSHNRGMVRMTPGGGVTKPSPTSRLSGGFGGINRGQPGMPMPEMSSPAMPGSVPGAPGDPAAPVKDLYKTDFVIQFAFKYIPPAARPPLETAPPAVDPAAAPPADPAAAPPMP